MHDAAFVQSLLGELQAEGGSGAELASRQRLVRLLTLTRTRTRTRTRTLTRWGWSGPSF